MIYLLDYAFCICICRFSFFVRRPAGDSSAMSGGSHLRQIMNDFLVRRPSGNGDPTESTKLTSKLHQVEEREGLQNFKLTIVL